MKCKTCGAALSLNTMYCPYCGKENAEAKQHVKDMAHYQGEFEATKKNVYEKTHAYTHNAVKIALVAILAIVWVGVLLLAANAYEISSAVKDAKNDRNYKKIESQIWEYLEAEEYYALSLYCSELEISTYDTKFEAYEPVIRLANQYQYVYECLLDILTPSPYDSGSMESKVGYLSDYIGYFYDNYNRNWKEYDYNNLFDMNVMQPEMDRMEYTLRVLLHTYAGLSEDEAAQLSTMKKGQRILLLEEGLLDEEE